MSLRRSDDRPLILNELVVIRQLEKSSHGKLSTKERVWSDEKDRLLETHRDEIVGLEVQMEQMRSDLYKTKETLHDAITVRAYFTTNIPRNISLIFHEKNKG